MSWKHRMSSSQLSKLKNNLRNGLGRPCRWEDAAQRPPQGQGRTARGRSAAGSAAVPDVGKDLFDLIRSESDAEPELSRDEEQTPVVDDVVDRGRCTPNSLDGLASGPSSPQMDSSARRTTSRGPDLINGKSDVEPELSRDDKEERTVDNFVTDQIAGDHGRDSPNSWDGLVSGPSSPQMASSAGRTPYPELCSGCRSLFQKAKRMKSSLIDKLQDNDPTSLTCDQWVLKKKWRSRRQSELERKLPAFDFRSIKKRLDLQRKSGVFLESSCSRPHIFMQRTFRLCTKVLVKPVKKQPAVRKKRPRSHTRDAPLAKRHQQHCFGSHSSLHPKGHLSSKLDLESCSDESTEQSPCRLPFDVSPSSITIGNDAQAGNPAASKQEPPVRGSGFKDLLVQLRGNSSMIVRE